MNSSNVTMAPATPDGFFTYNIYDADIGPAVWQVDIGLGVLFSICLLQALLGNAVILFLLARYKPYISANAFTVLAVTLSISDILMVVLSGLPSTISLLQMRKKMDQRFCDVSGFALNFNMRLNSFITTCICMVRCLVVVMPIKARILLNKRALSAMVVCCVIMATFYSSIPFLFNNITRDQITKYTYYKYIGFCMFFVYFEEQTVRIASTFLTEMVFFLPFIVAIVTSSVLLYTLNRRNKYIGLEAKNETKRSAVIVIIRVTILTLICCTPQLAFSIYTKINRAHELNWFSLRTEMYLNYMFGQQLIIYLRASINPFIIDMPAYLKRGKAMRKTKLAMKEHGKLSVASHLTNSKVIYRARPGTITYGNSVVSTPLNTPRRLEVELKVPPREVNRRCPLEEGDKSSLQGGEVTRAKMFEQHNSSVLEYRSAEEMLGNGHGELEVSQRKMYRKKRRAKSTENVSGDVVMDKYVRGALNGYSGEETGKRQIKVRRSKTDCGARRGKVLARTQSAKWSQKFLIGHND